MDCSTHAGLGHCQNIPPHQHHPNLLRNNHFSFFVNFLYIMKFDGSVCNSGTNVPMSSLLPQPKNASFNVTRFDWLYRLLRLQSGVSRRTSACMNVCCLHMLVDCPARVHRDKSCVQSWAVQLSPVQKVLEETV